MIDNTNNCKIFANELLSKSKKLVGSFKHSSQLQNKLKDAQNKLKYSSKIKLVQDVPTRWNSSHDMLESICINADALKLLNLDPEIKSIKSNVPNEADFIVLNELCILLQPLKDLTEMLSVSKYVSISILYPVIYNLLNFQLPSLEISNINLSELKEELCKSLNARFTYVWNDKIFATATLFDFKFRRFEFIKDNETLRLKTVKDAKEYLIELYNKYFTNGDISHENQNPQENIRQNKSSKTSNDGTVTGKRKKDILSSLYDNQVLTESISNVSSIEIA